MNIPENDWKLFKSKIVTRQESYMEKLNAEYIELLSQNKYASEIFWELEKRINNDKHSPGVRLNIRRSNTFENIALLLGEGVIDFNDLGEFSPEIQDAVRLMTNCYE